MNRYVAAIVVAATAVTAFTATANAHPINQKRISLIDSYGHVTVVNPNPNDVWVGSELAGRDPDPLVRLELLRTFGNF